MNWKRFAVCLSLVLLVASAGAADMKGKTVIGIRGPVFVPLFGGSDFMLNNVRKQPFQIGWDFGIEAKRGISNQFMLGITANYLSTYDDSTRTDPSHVALNKSDHAMGKLTGMAFGLEGDWFMQPNWKIQPYLLGGIGLDFWKMKNLVTKTTHNSSDFNFKVGGGLVFPITDNFTLDAQVKLTTTISNLSQSVPAGFYGQSTWKYRADRPINGYLEPSIGLSFMFGGGLDHDHDGVVDGKDNCPDTPQGVKVDKKGCPIDSDGDGVADYLDKCPNTPAGVKVDASGCPLDSDGDGVADYLDKCPNTPAGIKVDANGCAPDADGDGVPDQLDKCPDTPKGIKVDASGCPLDSDGDGVLDNADKCPDTPRGVKVDSDGCPIVKKIAETEKITLHINYATNSYEPDEKSKHQLDSVAERIIAYPDTKIHISGYTDSRGSEQKNQTLSENRANGVMQYLESKGVHKDCMTAKGYGMNPKYYVADNKTEAGRAQNRRVEIVSVK